MFCKNCGSNIKEGSGFCPKCGCSIKKTLVPPSGEMPLEFETMINHVVGSDVSDKKKENSFKKFLPAVGIGVVVLAVLVGIVGFAARLHQTKDEEVEETEEEIEYSLVGDWISTDDCDLGDVFVALLEKEGFGSLASSVVQLLGLDESGQINLNFRENGDMELGVDNMFAKIGEFTYEDHGGSVMLNVNLDVGGSIGAFGFEFGLDSIPIAISYKAKYRIDQDGLLLDLFGTKLTFIPDDL